MILEEMLEKQASAHFWTLGGCDHRMSCQLDYFNEEIKGIKIHRLWQLWDNPHTHVTKRATSSDVHLPRSEGSECRVWKRLPDTSPVGPWGTWFAPEKPNLWKNIRGALDCSVFQQNIQLFIIKLWNSGPSWSKTSPYLLKSLRYFFKKV